MVLTAQNLKIFRNHKPVLDLQKIEVQPGEIVALLGPNGAGKSTLLQALSGEFSSITKNITLNKKNINGWPLEKKAQLMAVLPQSNPINFPLTILEVVLLGRIPHQTSKIENINIAKECLQAVDMESTENRFYSQLSGGERQRVQIARILAQINKYETGKYLLLDEPTSALDLAHQHLVLRLLKTLAKQGIGILITLHDLNLAMKYSDRVILLQEGQTVANGKADEVLNVENVEKVFNLPVTIIKDPCPNISENWIAVL